MSACISDQIHHSLQSIELMSFRTVIMLLDPRKTKSRRVRLSSLRVAMLAPSFVIPLDVAFAADEVHDEIQVYNAEIASVGQWTYQQHLNYAAIGQNQPEVPGGFSSNLQSPGI